MLLTLTGKLKDCNNQAVCASAASELCSTSPEKRWVNKGECHFTFRYFVNTKKKINWNMLHSKDLQDIFHTKNSLISCQLFY